MKFLTSLVVKITGNVEKKNLIKNF